MITGTVLSSAELDVERPEEAWRGQHHGQDTEDTAGRAEAALSLNGVGRWDRCGMDGDSLKKCADSPRLLSQRSSSTKVRVAAAQAPLNSTTHSNNPPFAPRPSEAATNRLP